jgi:hypothetical protein
MSREELTKRSWLSSNYEQLAKRYYASSGNLNEEEVEEEDSS